MLNLNLRVLKNSRGAVLTHLFELTVEDVKERNRVQSQDAIIEAIEAALAD